MSERKMATFRVIKDLRPIPDAAFIETAIVDGWEVVVKKGDFKVGEVVIYLEIDSWVPIELAPFLRSNQDKKRIYNGVDGERLRTKKLKGQISQGLVLPLSVLAAPACFKPDMASDLSPLLNVQKWEMEIPVQLRGQVKGSFPYFIPKTDQERIQNCWNEVFGFQMDWQFEITEKLDGSSMTVYLKDGVFGVCSRNIDLKYDPENAFWKAAEKYNLQEKLMILSEYTGYHELALQGELIGPGIQGNKYDRKELEFYLFEIYDITDQQYMTPQERTACAWKAKIPHVPILEPDCFFEANTIHDVLEAATGPSAVMNSNVLREGLVFKRVDGQYSFKAISNEWLLKYKD
jgi:RNA ligase (TIGR02306 family)